MSTGSVGAPKTSAISLPTLQGGVAIPVYNPNTPAQSNTYTTADALNREGELQKAFETNPQEAQQAIAQDITDRFAKGDADKARFSVGDPTLNRGLTHNIDTAYDAKKDEITLTLPNGESKTFPAGDPTKVNADIDKYLKDKGIENRNFHIREIDAKDTPKMLETLKHLDAKAIRMDTVNGKGQDLALKNTRFAFFEQNGKGTLHLDRGMGIKPVPVSMQMQGTVDDLSFEGTNGTDTFYSRWQGANTTTFDGDRGNDVYSARDIKAVIKDDSGQNLAEVVNGKSGSSVTFSSDAEKGQTTTRSFAHLMGGTTSYIDKSKNNSTENANMVYLDTKDYQHEVKLQGNYVSVLESQTSATYNPDSFGMKDGKVLRYYKETGSVYDEATGKTRTAVEAKAYKNESGFLGIGGGVTEITAATPDAGFAPDPIDNSPSFFSSPGFAIALIALVGGISTALTAENGYVSGYGGGYSGGNDYGGFA